MFLSPLSLLPGIWCWADHIKAIIIAVFKTPKDLLFLFLYIFLASRTDQWRAYQETSSGCCLWCGAEIRPKSAERNGGVWMVHQPAERRDELYQRREPLMIVYGLYSFVVCKMVELEALMRIY
jgi:hypothetical protein